MDADEERVNVDVLIIPKIVLILISDVNDRRCLQWLASASIIINSTLNRDKMTDRKT